MKRSECKGSAEKTQPVYGTMPCFSIIAFQLEVSRRFACGRKRREQDKKRAIFPINTLYGVLQTVSIPAETYTPEALSIHSQYTHIELHTRCMGLLHKANTIALRTSYGFLWAAELNSAKAVDPSGKKGCLNGKQEGKQENNTRRGETNAK